ncbi:unnamed protein product [Rotaria magnacalcarata]|uniref:protein-tyrosine-phosphatase n=1 Tax=Rotaria magnacalcarata TaxID=392030 RepID=A0A816M5U9_9BILA|nr:unnamed protein product [Rotaria magnacalcarata]CAF1406110.1 unnamed protein product [Rotaria magnacalcarata]CAF1978365.1 unnamed protein product [Rotaria magnacalcarata]
MLWNYSWSLLISRYYWIIFIIILYIILKMLTLYTQKTVTDDDHSLIMTDEECERIKILEHERSLAFDKYYRFGRTAEPSLVLDDFLFLGNLQHASNRVLLERFKIKHILNVCDLGLEQNIMNNFNVIHIPMPDEPQTNIKKHFDRTNELLHGIYEKKECCLVHCAAGISRSATIVLAYLMKYHHNTLKEAFFFLIEKRPQIWPNEGFLLQLLRYETELIRSREITANDNESTEAIQMQENPIETLNEFEHKHEKDE